VTAPNWLPDVDLRGPLLGEEGAFRGSLSPLVVPPAPAGSLQKGSPSERGRNLSLTCRNTSAWPPFPPRAREACRTTTSKSCQFETLGRSPINEKADETRKTATDESKLDNFASPKIVLIPFYCSPTTNNNNNQQQRPKTKHRTSAWTQIGTPKSEMEKRGKM